MKKHLWVVPAVASVLFLGFTLQVMTTESLFGFVTEHCRSGWGLQIFIDLVSAATVALVFSRHACREHNIRQWPWVLLTVATGSIGLFAFAARIFYAEAAALEKAEHSTGPVKLGTAPV
jgi:hypothetical protein